jgi:POT family proton-dependent oligopeptide transporter
VARPAPRDLLGTACIALGTLASACPPSSRTRLFFLGLILIVHGHRPAQAEHLGARRRPLSGEAARAGRGFAIFYMGINSGAFIAPISPGAAARSVGWHWGFGAAGVGCSGRVCFRRGVAPHTSAPSAPLPSGTPAQQRPCAQRRSPWRPRAVINGLADGDGAGAVNPLAIAQQMTS